MSHFMKTRLVGAELIHADGRTDRIDEAHSRFSQFLEKKKSENFCFIRKYCLYYQAIQLLSEHYTELHRL